MCISISCGIWPGISPAGQLATFGLSVSQPQYCVIMCIVYLVAMTAWPVNIIHVAISHVIIMAWRKPLCGHVAASLVRHCGRPRPAIVAADDWHLSQWCVDDHYRGHGRSVVGCVRYRTSSIDDETWLMAAIDVAGDIGVNGNDVSVVINVDANLAIIMWPQLCISMYQLASSASIVSAMAWLCKLSINGSNIISIANNGNGGVIMVMWRISMWIWHQYKLK